MIFGLYTIRSKKAENHPESTVTSLLCRENYHCGHDVHTGYGSTVNLSYFKTTGDTTMKNRSISFISGIVLIFLCFPIGCISSNIHSKSGTTTTLILFRHADRDDMGRLTPKGHERARALVDTVGHKGVTAIYSPNLKRNLDTVKPLADHLGIDITLTPKVSLFVVNKIVNEILNKHSGGVVSWVGNVSGNLQVIFRKLGGRGKGPLEYGDLFIMTIPDRGPVNVTKSRFGS